MVYVRNLQSFDFRNGCCVVNDESHYLTRQLLSTIEENAKVITFGLDISKKFDKKINNTCYHFLSDSEFYTAIKESPEYVIFNGIRGLNDERNVSKVTSLVECGYKVILVNSSFDIDNFHPQIQNHVYHLNSAKLERNFFAM